jgi:two-component system chemotaxis response regulator CheB
MTNKIRVLVVDDSALVRRAITDVLHRDEAIEVVGVAHDPIIAMDKMPKLQPHVLTLDIEMPRMDGITFLRQLRAAGNQIPVVIVSSLSPEGSELALKALELGACEVLAKPNSSMDIGNLGPRLALAIKAAAQSTNRRTRVQVPQRQAAVVKAPTLATQTSDRRLIVIGASTGGVEALRFLIPALPAGLPPIVVVQHIPPVFSNSVAQRLDLLSQCAVREACDGETLKHDLCLIAPGDHHLSVTSQSSGYVTRLTQTPHINYCRPAVDVLFRSAATAAGRNCLAVLLTGMGNDGAAGMQWVKKLGGITLAEDEASCVVFGMPRAAIQLGVVDRVATLEQMPGAILQSLAQLSD